MCFAAGPHVGRKGNWGDKETWQPVPYSAR
jgi:hypothetical protein